ncbi:MAG TPA: hypothetical protein VH208_00190, partial [Myxococcaceae bacterium]|nr:hypothetical protein [Myxococcaceae bacterium]
MSVKFSKPLPTAREDLLEQRRVSILRVPKGLEDKSARSLNPRPLSYEPGVVSLKDKLLKRPLTVLSFNSWDGGSDHIIGSEGYEQRNPSEPFFRERSINLTSIPRPHEELAGSGQMILGKRLSQLRDEKLFVPLYDKTERTLSTKILDRPDLMEYLRHEAAGGPAVISAYKSAVRVREVADKLGITLIGANEGKDKYGHKDWAGIIFDRAGVRYPLQTETVKDVDGLSQEIARLLPKLPDHSTVMIKHVDSTSGNGVAPLDVSSIPAEVRKNEAETTARVKQLLLDSKTLDVTAMPHPEFVSRFKDGVLAQEYIPFTLSPSGQRYIDEAHRSHYVSTGVQVLNDGKIYKGAMSGAPEDLQKMLVTDTQKIGGVLAKLGVTGNFGVDFLAKPKTGGGWDLYACEINIRRLGTTHPVEMMSALFGGSFGKDGFFHTRDGRKLAYEITDSVGEEGLPEPQNYEKFVGLTSADAYDLAARHGMLANDRSSEGIWPNMTVLLREYGKSGALAYAPTLERANGLLHDWKHVLTDAAAQRRPPKATG